MRRELTAPVGVLLCVLAACASAPVCPQPGADNRLHEIQVLRHRWHTGIVLPGDQLSDELAFLRDGLGDAPYYEIGWGDESFYRATRVELGLAARALLWPTETVMHVVALERAPDSYPHTDIRTLLIDEAGMHGLREAIAATFQQDLGAPAFIDAGLYGRSAFFVADGTFWLGNTCNSWTIRKLNAAGLPAGRNRLTAGAVMRRVHRLADQCE